MNSSVKSTIVSFVVVLFIQFGAFAQLEVTSAAFTQIPQSENLQLAGGEMAMNAANTNGHESLYHAMEADLETRNLVTLVSLVPDAAGNSIHLFNPEQLNLSLEVKTESGRSVEGWLRENFSDSDTRQKIQVSDLKPGVYRVEVSAPNRQMVSIRFTKL